MSMRGMAQVAVLLAVAGICWGLGESNLHVHRLPVFLGVMLCLSALLVVAILWLEPKDGE